MTRARRSRIWYLATRPSSHTGCRSTVTSCQVTGHSWSQTPSGTSLGSLSTEDSDRSEEDCPKSFPNGPFFLSNPPKSKRRRASFRYSLFHLVIPKFRAKWGRGSETGPSSQLYHTTGLRLGGPQPLAAILNDLLCDVYGWSMSSGGVDSG